MRIKQYYNGTIDYIKNLEKDTKKAILLLGASAIIGWPFLQLPIQLMEGIRYPIISKEQAEEIIIEEKKKHNFNENIELIVKDGFFESAAECELLGTKVPSVAS